MNQQVELWNQFCEKYVSKNLGIPLFDVDKNVVNIKKYGKNERLILKRSQEMENLVIREVNKVLNDFENNQDIYEGLIYMMYIVKNNIITPLYIGKSEKYGKQGDNLSGNISKIEGNKSFFCRWGDNYAYHIGDLSAVVCPGHAKEKIARKYQRWASLLFESYPTSAPVLKEDVYFWICAWEKGNVGIFKEFGSTPLTALEYQLISVAATIFPNSLLNHEGVNRGLKFNWILWIILWQLYSTTISAQLIKT